MFFYPIQKEVAQDKGGVAQETLSSLWGLVETREQPAPGSPGL
jgi:hypothetical protein